MRRLGGGSLAATCGAGIPRAVSRRFGASRGARAPGIIDGGASSSSSSPMLLLLGGGQVTAWDRGGVGAVAGGSLAPTAGIPGTVVRRIRTVIAPMVSEPSHPG